jgi:hypothetical protein
MAILVNYLNCNTQQLGTGVIECMANINSEPIGFFLVDNRWSLPVADPSVFDTDYLLDRIQDGTFIPFLNRINFTPNTEETVFQTFDSGIKGRVRSGFPEFSFEFDKGLYFHKAAYSHNSFNKYNVAMVFANNTILFALSVDGLLITGFQAGYVDTATYKLKTGSTVTSSMVGFQLTNPDQFNLRAVPLESQQSLIDFSQINGRVDVSLVLQTPLAAATTLVFSARAAANSAIDILGLSDTDLRVVGTTGNITGLTYDALTQLYTITLDAGVAATENIYVQLYDATFTPDPVPAIQLAGEIYAGTSNTVIVL